MNQPKPFPVPSNWKWVPFGSCARLINGRAYKASELLRHGTPVIRIQNLNKGNRWFYSNLKLPDDKYCESGDLLFAWSATFGPYIWGGPKAIYHYHIWKVQPGSILDKQFAYYLLKWVSTLIKQSAHGITMVHMTKAGMEKWLIPLPPLEEQRRIAAILDKADAVRRKRQVSIRLTEEFLKSVFLDIFGNPVTNPKGWETTNLASVCCRVTDGTHQPPTWSNEGIPFLFVSNIIDGEIDFQVKKYITEKAWRTLTARCPIELNDILYTTVGSYGNAALVKTRKPFCFQRHIAHIKPDANSIHPEFLLGQMQSEGVRRQADREARGVAQKTLNLRELKNFKLILPPKRDQDSYVQLRRYVEFVLTIQRKLNLEAWNLFNSLVQRAFKGEL